MNKGIILFRDFLSLVKFSHTIFAMPFAMIGFVMGVQQSGSFDWRLLILIVLCMVLARNAAMGFNRFIDAKYDRLNERTKVRDIPAGKIKPLWALIFVFFNAAAFVLTAYCINPLCFYLSPVALAVILGYSYTKRFTSLCHLVLGVGLSLAPIGAYLAVTGQFALIPVLLSFAVLFWVSGFDIIYALQDEHFDKENKLHSIPVFLGKKGALLFSRFLHLSSVLVIIMIGLLSSYGYLYWLGAAVFAFLLIYQHTLVKPNDLSRVNLAFFTLNGVASLIFGILVISGLLLRS